MSAVSPLSKPQGVALFDLDGTLLPWDSQLLFRRLVLLREPWRARFLPIFFAFIPFAWILGSGGMKRVFLCYLWKMSPATLATYSQLFAGWLVPSFYPELYEKIEQHRSQGHLLILSSASPECYVKEIGRLLNFDLALGTPIELGPFFPDLENHKGQAKVQRLQQLLPNSFFENGKLKHSHGYTDSCADLPMLALCQSATVVNPSSKLTAIAKQSGWEILRPTRPWKSKISFYIQVIGWLIARPWIRSTPL